MKMPEYLSDVLICVDRVCNRDLLFSYDTLPGSPTKSTGGNRPSRGARPAPHYGGSRAFTVHRGHCEGGSALAPRRTDGSPAYKHPGRHLRGVLHPERKHDFNERLVSTHDFLLLKLIMNGMLIVTYLLGTSHTTLTSTKTP